MLLFERFIDDEILIVGFGNIEFSIDKRLVLVSVFGVWILKLKREECGIPMNGLIDNRVDMVNFLRSGRFEFVNKIEIEPILIYLVVNDNNLVDEARVELDIGFGI